MDYKPLILKLISLELSKVHQHLPHLAPGTNALGAVYQALRIATDVSSHRITVAF